MFDWQINTKTQNNFTVYLNDIGGEWKDFVWSSKKVNHSIEITGKTILMVQKVKIINPDELTSMDLEDDSLTAIIHPN